MRLDSARHVSLTHSQGDGSGQRRREASPATEAVVRSQHVVELEDVGVEIAASMVGDVDKETAVVVEAEVIGEIVVDVFAAILSPSGFTGQSFNLFLLRLC